jgi:hypothetical protein
VVFTDVLWWLGSFSVVLWWLLLMVLALQPLVFSSFLEVIQDGCHFRGWSSHLLELNNGSCVDGERGDIEGRDDGLGDDDGGGCGGSVGGIHPSV